MGVVGFLVGRFVTVLVIFVALTVGWLASSELAVGRLFAVVIPLTKGIMPPEIVGHGHMVGTPVVPDDATAQPRPIHEVFLSLPGGSDRGMPAVGLGMCCRPTAYDDVLVRRSVLWYLLLGGRHIDGAHLYLNHAAIGQAIRDAVQRGIPREEIFVTTKLWPSHFGYNKTLEMIPRFATELGLEYIDLVLMHMPSSPSAWFMPNDCTRAGIDAPTCRQETWKALSEMRAQGIVRHVGVSNFAISHLQDVAAVPNGAPIANNQIQYSPFVPQSVHDIVAYCQAHNITVTAYSPLGGLVDQDRAAATQALQYIADAHGVKVQQVMLRWALQKNLAVIPGTGNPDHMKENLAIYDFQLTDADMQAIDGLKFNAEAEKFLHMDINTWA
uniref:NADP-dependent oxidoreductase domain-containing protein n=1 Tax=Amphora coffeiformis TaxID=265554 RepID=A0A7S3P5A8_9STRA|mmetsp:Transcript_17779/g.33754  ORF Transcript_17779/g.33754 Transcript_17779/m.33754 type:complete len:384 (-) Transcript_17779:54-1205(-)